MFISLSLFLCFPLSLFHYLIDFLEFHAYQEENQSSLVETQLDGNVVSLMYAVIKCQKFYFFGVNF